MSFWGIEVKPGKPYPYHSDDVQGKLRVTQATLGLGTSEERCILQCSVGHKSPIFLCSLLPGKAESCTLNLEFSDELVAFSVIGPRSIHLCGYFDSEKGDHLRDEYEYDSGETIADTESDESSEYDYDDEYDDDDDFIDDDNDLQIYTSSPIPSGGVVIEEIAEDDKPEKVNGKSKRLKKKKKNQSSDQEDQNNSQGQIALKRDEGISVLESEDEDVEKRERLKALIKMVNQKAKQRKKKKKNKQREQGAEENIDTMDDKEENNNASRDEIKPEEVKRQDSTDGNKHDQRGLDTDADSMPGEDSSDKKKKKKKNKTQDRGTATKEQAISTVGGEAKYLLDSEDKQSATKSSQVRTFSNGLVIEELSMGKPDGKRASPGSQVSVRYIGKLKKNDKIFDSNVGRAPFKFRLGVGQVIKGWDVGVNGMRVGDKRRFTIPPSMGYGERGAGGKIPPNSWLVFDVELVNVR
ncbi:PEPTIDYLPROLYL ISOMERASE [Salix viminalis]|uniref:FK506-binding protein n=1 Tax=Salix viminalis TaxID=40686 RepID=A0A9Q0NUN4_SALVM|nr:PEPTIDYLPROLYL ISOMERASE [Salix viminalis]